MGNLPFPTCPIDPFPTCPNGPLPVDGIIAFYKTGMGSTRRTHVSTCRMKFRNLVDVFVFFSEAKVITKLTRGNRTDGNLIVPISCMHSSAI